MRVVYYKDTHRMWHWRIVSDDGRPIAVSADGFWRLAEAQSIVAKMFQAIRTTQIQAIK